MHESSLYRQSYCFICNAHLCNYFGYVITITLMLTLISLHNGFLFHCMHYTAVITRVLQQLHEEIDFMEQCNYNENILSVLLSPLWALVQIVAVCLLSMSLTIRYIFAICMCIKDKHMYRTINRISASEVLLIIISLFPISLSSPIAIMKSIFYTSLMLVPSWNDQNITWKEIAECNSVTVKTIIFQALLCAFDAFIVFGVFSAVFLNTISSKLSGDKTNDHEESRVQVLQYLV